MTIAIELAGATAEELANRADDLGVGASVLAEALLLDLLSSQDDDFERIATAALDRNRELYDRLA